jgi:hypothetical protein
VYFAQTKLLNTIDDLPKHDINSSRILRDFYSLDAMCGSVISMVMGLPYSSRGAYTPLK